MYVRVCTCMYVYVCILNAANRFATTNNNKKYVNIWQFQQEENQKCNNYDVIARRQINTKIEVIQMTYHNNSSFKFQNKVKMSTKVEETFPQNEN